VRSLSLCWYAADHNWRTSAAASDVRPLGALQRSPARQPATLCLGEIHAQSLHCQLRSFYRDDLPPLFAPIVIDTDYLYTDTHSPLLHQSGSLSRALDSATQNRSGCNSPDSASLRLMFRKPSSKADRVSAKARRFGRASCGEHLNTGLNQDSIRHRGAFSLPLQHQSVSGRAATVLRRSGTPATQANGKVILFLTLLNIDDSNVPLPHIQGRRCRGIFPADGA